MIDIIVNGVDNASDEFKRIGNAAERSFQQAERASARLSNNLSNSGDQVYRHWSRMSSASDQAVQHFSRMSSSIQTVQRNFDSSVNRMATKWDWYRAKMIASNTKMLNEATKSQKVIDNLSRMNVRGLDQQFLKISDSLEKMAKQGDITNVALKELGPSASFWDLKNQIKLINSGLARMQALQIGVGIAFLGINIGLAKMSSIVDGRLSPAFEKFQETWLSALTPFVKAWTTAVEAIINFGTMIGKAFDALAQFSPLLSQMIFGFLYLTTALTLLLAPLAIGISATGSFAVAFNVLWAAISPFVIGLMTVIGTAMMWAAAITVVVAAIYLLWTRCEAFRTAVINIWNDIKSAVTTAFQAVVDYLTPAVEAVVAFVLQQWQKIITWWTTNGTTILQAIQNVFDFILPIIMMAINDLLPVLQAAWNVIVTVVQVAWDVIVTVITAAIGLVTNIISLFANLLTGQWGAAWENMKNIVSIAWDTMLSLISIAFNGIISIISTVMTLIGTIISNAWNMILNIIIGVLTPIGAFIMFIWNSIVSFIVSVWTSILSFATSIWNGIKNFVVSAFQWMYNHNYYFKALVDSIVRAWNTAKASTLNIWNAVKSFITGVWNGIKSTASSVWNSIKSVITSAVNAAKSVITSAWNAIKSATTSAFNSVKSTVSSIMNSIASVLGGLAGKASAWGSNLMNMFISGIKSKISALTSMVSGVAKQVAGFLGFHSPTKWGPASDSDEWAPNFMKMFSDGIESGIPKIRMAATNAADATSQIQKPTSTSSSNDSRQQPIINIYEAQRTTDKEVLNAMRKAAFLYG